MQQYSDVVLVASVPGGPVRAPAAASVQVNITGGAAATLYSDNGITTRANPIIADSSGEYSFYAANGTYDLVISVTGFTTETKTAAVQLFDAAASSGASGIGFLPSGTGPTYGWATRTMAAKASDFLSVKDVKGSDGLPAAGDNSHDDTSAIQAALNAAGQSGTGATVWLPRGNYKITSTLTIPTKVTLQGESRETSFISYSGTATALDVAGVSQTTLRDFRLYPGTSATAVGIALRSSVGASIFWNKVRDVEIAGSSVAGQIGIKVLATAPEIVTSCWFNDINITGIDRPVVSTNDEGNFWHGLDISLWGMTAGTIAVDATGANTDFWIGIRVSGVPVGANCVAFKTNGVAHTVLIAADMESTHTAFNVTGTGNTLILARTVSNPVGKGTVVAGNNFIDGTSGYNGVIGATTPAAGFFNAVSVTQITSTNSAGGTLLNVTNGVDANLTAVITASGAGTKTATLGAPNTPLLLSALGTEFARGDAAGMQISAFRFREAQGAVLTAANNLTLGTDGNYFQVNGATQINLILNTNWQGGSVVTLKFNSTPTVKHNQGASGNNKPIILNGAADLVAAANNTLTLRYDSTDACWYEQSRKV